MYAKMIKIRSIETFKIVNMTTNNFDKICALTKLNRVSCYKYNKYG